MTPIEFATAVLAAQRIHEESYVKGDPIVFDDGPQFPTGAYTKDHMMAACEALGEPFEGHMGSGMAYPLYLLNSTAWNDIQSWAEDVLGTAQTTPEGKDNG
jgi:hypothetical protein